MKILLIDNGTTLLQKLRVLIPGDEIVHLPSRIERGDLTDFDLIVLSGSKELTANYHRDHFKKEIKLIQDTQTPIIGICLGCELIAVAFGGTVRRLEERHSGAREIEIISNNSTLGIRKGDLHKVYEGHRWIIDSTPDDFEILAVSNDGPEIIHHKTRSIWGFQFHPENFVDQTEGDEMFLNLFLKLAQK